MRLDLNYYLLNCNSSFHVRSAHSIKFDLLGNSKFSIVNKAALICVYRAIELYIPPHKHTRTHANEYTRIRTATFYFAVAVCLYMWTKRQINTKTSAVLFTIDVPMRTCVGAIHYPRSMNVHVCMSNAVRTGIYTLLSSIHIFIV